MNVLINSMVCYVKEERELYMPVVVVRYSHLHITHYTFLLRPDLASRSRKWPAGTELSSCLWHPDILVFPVSSHPGSQLLKEDSNLTAAEGCAPKPIQCAVFFLFKKSNRHWREHKCCVCMWFYSSVLSIQQGLPFQVTTEHLIRCVTEPEHLHWELLTTGADMS